MPNTWTFILSSNHIDCISPQEVDWENPLSAITAQLNQFGLVEKQNEIGADRYQMWFEFDYQTYVVMCETLCAAIWIEPLNKGNSHGLTLLWAHLQNVN